MSTIFEHIHNFKHLFYSATEQIIDKVVFVL